MKRPVRSRMGDSYLMSDDQVDLKELESLARLAKIAPQPLPNFDQLIVL